MMKTKYFIVLFICLIVKGTFAQENFQINISAPNYPDGTKLLVVLLENDKRARIKRDSVVIVNQKASLSGTITQPSNFVNFVMGSGKSYRVTSLAIDTGQNDFILDPSSVAHSVPIKAINSISNDIIKSLDSVRNYHYDNYATKHKDSGSETLDKSAQLELTYDQVQFLEKYPDNYTSLISLYEISLYHKKEEVAQVILERFRTFSPEIVNSAFGEGFHNSLAKYLENISAANVGAPVPKFSVKDFEGNDLNNESLAGQNYIVVFSATWCAPCQEALPSLISLYDQYKSSGLKIVYFNNDDNLSLWAKHIEKNKLSWINVSERVKSSRSVIPIEFNTYYVPSYFVVNKSGKIVFNSVQSGSEFDKLKASVEDLYRNQL